jgi:hypothetical protein
MSDSRHDTGSRLIRTTVLLGALLLPIITDAQDSHQQAGAWEFLPSKTLVRPSLADNQEPRIGLRKEAGSSRMKLDIGGMLDLVELKFGDHRIRAGIDFFTFALTTSYQNLRLQVDAVDGFFGGHLSYRSSIPQPYVMIRLRLLHHSSHFVDGHLTSPGSTTWRDDRAPEPLAQDFGEIMLAHSGAIGNCTIAPYVGGSYAVLSRPDALKKMNGMAGLLIQFKAWSGSESGKTGYVYLADHFTLSGYRVYVGTNDVEGGIKFGPWEAPGLRIYAGYHSGREIFSQYFDTIRDYWGIGFAVDLW